MAITAQEVNKLRQMTGAGMMDCKKALVESEGDMEAAIDILRKKGQKVAAKRADRDADEGVVLAKVSEDGTFAAAVMVNCETDFVAKNDDFKAFAKNIAMHIAATNPVGIRPEDVSEEIIKKEKEIYLGQVLEMGKPEKIADKIVEGKLNKYFKENCLMDQAYVRNPEITIADLLN